jgi:two-component SAPR family response regulator
MSTSSASPRILVLEDDPDMRKILAEVLEGQGYLVTAVASGQAAVDEAARQAYSLIVADIRMEGMTGLEALAKTKSYQPEIGSLIVSGYATPEETERAAELGVGAYLKKPFRMKRFLEAVRAQLSRVVREEEVQASESLSDEAIVWALGTHLETVDSEGLFASPGCLEKIAKTAYSLARSVRFSKAAARQLSVAAQLLKLQDTSFAQVPDWLLANEELVGPLTRALTVKTSPEAQVAQLAACSQESPAPQESDYQPDLWSAFQNLDEVEHEPEALVNEARDSKRAGSLLLLGRTLAQSGDVSNARSAYEKALVLAQSPEERTKVQLESLGFELTKERCTDFAERCQELTEMVEELGPFAGSKLQLEVGLLQWRGGLSDQARENLSQAAERLQKLGHETLEGVSRVALQQAGVPQERLETAVSQLLHPSGLDELTNRAYWLIPAISEANISTELVGQLVVRVPQVLAYAVTQSSVSLDGRHRILSALCNSSSPPPSLVRALAGDADPAIREKASRLTSSAEESSRPLIRIYTFGGFEAYVGDELVSSKEWRTKKTMYLVALIAQHIPRGILEEQILNLFWPDDVIKGKKNFNWALSMARGCLRGDDSFNPIPRERGRLNFCPQQPVWHDLSEFRRALKDSQEATGRALSLSLARLQRLYKGPYLDGCYFDWAVRLRDELERKAGEAFLHLAQVLHQSELYDEAIEAARASLESAPCNQDSHLILMQSETRRGRPIAALEQFRKCEKILRDEYEIEPGIDLMKAELEARMLV